MTTLEEYSEPLERAIDKMRSQMAQPANVAKRHWLETPYQFLRERIDVNMRHLHSAYLTKNTDDAARYAANVANHAWMIADKVRFLNESEETT